MSSFGAAAGGGADDDAAGEAVLLAELADDAAQAAALFARIDLARDADVIDRRHEDQEPARHRHVRGEARALGAERLLDDLDEDVLAFLQQVFDLGLGPVALVPRSRPPRAASSRSRRTAAFAAAALGPAARDRCGGRPRARRPSTAGMAASAGGLGAARRGGLGRLGRESRPPVAACLARRPARRPRRRRGARIPRRC